MEKICKEKSVYKKYTRHLFIRLSQKIQTTSSQSLRGINENLAGKTNSIKIKFVLVLPHLHSRYSKTPVDAWNHHVYLYYAFSYTNMPIWTYAHILSISYTHTYLYTYTHKYAYIQICYFYCIINILYLNTKLYYFP